MINNIISIFLSAAIVFGGTMPIQVKESTVTATVPITVGAQQAVYEKWSVKSEQVKYYYYSESMSDDYNPLSPRTGYSGYTVNANGSLTLTGKLSQEIGGRCYSPPCPGTCHPGGYYLENNSYFYCAYAGYTDGTTSRCVYVTYILQQRTGMREEFSKDIFISSVTADANSLPADGKHTDGYWYVLKNLVED